MLVPPTARIVTFRPVSKTKGAPIFLLAMPQAGKLTAIMAHHEGGIVSRRAPC